jgi:hypothetical protein
VAWSRRGAAAIPARLRSMPIIGPALLMRSSAPGFGRGGASIRSSVGVGLEPSPSRMWARRFAARTACPHAPPSQHSPAPNRRPGSAVSNAAARLPWRKKATTNFMTRCQHGCTLCRICASARAVETSTTRHNQRYSVGERRK